MFEATDDFSSEELREMVLGGGDSEGSEMIEELAESLNNEGWSPFIPETFRNDEYFKSRSLCREHYWTVSDKHEPQVPQKY